VTLGRLIQDRAVAISKYAHYGRRSGRKIRGGRQKLLETLLPELRVSVPAIGRLDFDKLIEVDGSSRELWLEIGFGQGEHLAAQAIENPTVLLIGCEPYVNGVSTLLRTIEAHEIHNIRIHDDDARILLDALPDASVGRLFLLFPDPWPKKRHHKRRFITMANLDLVCRILKDGAELCFATDHLGYARWALWHAIHHEAIEWHAESHTDWTDRPVDWRTTRYEKKALTAEQSCTYFSFRRRHRVDASGV